MLLLDRSCCGRTRSPSATSFLCSDSSRCQAIVEQSDCLSLVQRRLAELFQRNYEIDLHPPPFEAPPLSIRAYWSRTVSATRRMLHFRKLLAAANPVGESIR